MQNQATKPKTTCGAHRREGYYFRAGLLTCRVCHLGADLHETSDETLDRRKREEAVSEWVNS